MTRRLLTLLGALALVVAALGVSASPASAAPNIEATSVALDGNADCEQGDLDVGMDAGTVDTETGTFSDLGGVLGEFSQGSGFTDFDGVFDGYGISSDTGPAPDGAVIGTYASIGTAPLTASSAAEWFVLYRCDSDGVDNEVLYSCFGDLGTCPSTAAEAADLLFGAEVSPAQVMAGGTLTVDGEGCLYPLAGAILTRDGTGIGVGDVVAPGSDGSFTIELVVPADLASGPLTVQVDCGTDGETVQQLELEVEVLGDVVTTTTTITTPSTTSTATPARPAVVTPRFTG